MRANSNGLSYVVGAMIIQAGAALPEMLESVLDAHSHARPPTPNAGSKLGGQADGLSFFAKLAGPSRSRATPRPMIGMDISGLRQPDLNAGARIIELPRLVDARGNLTAVE